MRLKVCGIRFFQNATQLQNLGIDFIGLNFYRGSKRYFLQKNPHLFYHCNSIAKSVKTQKVALFVNAPIKSMVFYARRFRCNIIQLHGKESPAVVRALRFQGFKVWKAFCLRDMEVLRMLPFFQEAHCWLFDGSRPGSGKRANKRYLQKAVSKAHRYGRPYGIAGGINPKNIKWFVKNFPKAYLLDVASGVERHQRFSLAAAKSLVKAFYAQLQKHS